MRPIRSFLLLLIFMACFTGLHYIIPVNQFFPSIYEFIPADLLNSLFSGEKNSKGKETVFLSDSVNIIVVDSIPLVDSVYSGDQDFSFGPMQEFLDSLRDSRGQTRIMYYGDSQIEGDRITSYLRQTLRKKSSGTGPGLFLPLMPVMYTKTIWLKSSSNWKKYNYLSYKSGEIAHRELGPFMAVCRFLPEGENAADPVKASVRIESSNIADSASSVYDYLRIFYGNTHGIVNVAVKSDGIAVLADTLKRGNGFNEISCELFGGKEILIEFTGNVSPDIYGISIESRTGLILDNIPQRGSAGLEFTMVDSSNLRESYKRLAPDLFILHYGLNIVKNVRDNYSYYQKGLVRQILLLKEISPLTPVLVISVTDMAVNEGDSIKSYSNIPAIIDAQERATLKADVAFWNSYQAMGGSSSIIKWAERKPPLAQKDFIHFTYTGADTLSELLVSSLFSISATDTIHRATTNTPVVTVPIAPGVVIDNSEIVVKKVSFIKSVLFSVLNYDPGKPFVFTSAAFWIFFLFVLAGYSLIYKKLILRNVYLFLISLFFYYKAGGLFLFILIFVTVIDYTCGLLIYKSGRAAARRFFVLLSIISNLGLLAYFKYTGFILSSINELFGTQFRVYDLLSTFSNSVLGTSFDISYIILPVGISFFTFQSLSYTIDVYRKKMEPVRNIIDFGFYVSFFPHLVAGPIVRASVFIPQIYHEFRVSRNEFSHALYMISKGLIKK